MEGSDEMSVGVDGRGRICKVEKEVVGVVLVAILFASMLSMKR